MEEAMKLEQYQVKIRAGKLCYFTSGKSWELPLRDLNNEYRSGFKKEPSYETATYNWFSSCNQTSVASAVRRGVSHLLFVTKYHGLIEEYRGKYLVTGAYEIGGVGQTKGRVFVKARSMVFTDARNAYELTYEKWLMICPVAQKPLANLRWATQTIKGEMFEEIYGQLCRYNRIEDYIWFVEHIKEREE